jgi:hypothetical protein
MLFLWPKKKKKKKKIAQVVICWAIPVLSCEDISYLNKEQGLKNIIDHRKNNEKQKEQGVNEQM